MTENQTLSNLLTSLKKAHISPTNRLRSIVRDADFVRSVARALGNRPLVANERCGSWYVRPEDKAGSAYFKSTDGHSGQWGFSGRRLNLQVLGLVEENDGCIIVDSTRRGKRMPDALSKTIPIWCTVLNMALFPSSPNSHTLHTPPSVVSPSEHAQITSLLPTFLASLQALDLNLDDLRKKISKPLRPMWITPDSRIGQPLLPFGTTDDDDDDNTETEERQTIFEDYRPVILLTASSSLSLTASELSCPEGYIQGAADDTEHWAMGLTAPLFWKNKDALLSASESELPELISTLLDQEKENATETPAREVAKGIFVTALPLSEDGGGDGDGEGKECQVVFLPKTTKREEWIKSPRRMEVGLGNQRLASKYLRSALPEICLFVETFMKECQTRGVSEPRIVIACESGKDVSLGTALAIRCHLFDDEGNFRVPAEEGTLNKAAIRTKLSRMMLAYPEANPHRSTLQSVNSFLMG